jgi:uncharacterized membrane protein YagU involved in acid resistance
VGALYGVLAETSPRFTKLVGGSGFGAAVWIAADEVAVPLLGLAEPDAEYSVEAHTQSFAAHMVYGVATDVVRRGVRALI